MRPGSTGGSIRSTRDSSACPATSKASALQRHWFYTDNFRTSIAQNEAPSQAGSWRSSACGGARASLRPPGATDDDARASSPVSSHDHAPAAGLACGGSKLHLGSLMMTRMACSQVHSEPHLTAASSSLNASLASSCAAARARASARPGGRLHAQRGAANLKISNPRYLHAAARCEGLSLCRARPRALQACPAALCGLQAPCHEQGPALARPDRELSVLASRFPTLSVPLRTVQQHRPAAPGKRRALDAYMNAPSACGAASAGAAAGAPTGAAAAPAAAAAGAATPLAVEAAATRADAASAGMATSTGDAAAAGSSFTTCKNCRSQHAELIYVCMYVM